MTVLLHLNIKSLPVLLSQFFLLPLFEKLHTKKPVFVTPTQLIKTLSVIGNSITRAVQG